jgi:superfamily II DNA helicase RecQ
MLRLIDQNEKASADEKRHQKDGVNEVVRYCQNNVTCRRVQVLAHFGQEFDPRDCHKHCDNCLNAGTAIQEDMTDYAVKALQLVQSLVSSGETVTQRQAMQVFKGANTQEVKAKGRDREPQHGAGASLGHEKVELLFSELLAIDALKIKNVKNKAGWNNASLVVRLSQTPKSCKPKLILFLGSAWPAVPRGDEPNNTRKNHLSSQGEILRCTDL